MPAIEEFNVVSLIFMVLALGVGLLLTTNHDADGLGERAAALCDLYLVGPFRFFRDAVGAFNLPALKAGLPCGSFPYFSAASSCFCSHRQIHCSRNGSA